MASHRQRNLVVMRHAKAEWPDGPDHERPLAERGRKDAAETGHRLLAGGITPDLVVCSPAVRTRETWRLLGKVYDHKPHTVYDERVYEASAQALLYLVQETPDEVDTLLLIGHNPGVATLVNALAGSGEDDTLVRLREKYPTSAVAVLSLHTPWSDLQERSAHLTRFTTPAG
ncbi:SixA phosphatase family protein [Embleya hyalina]|uniref:Phosphohistidine phosphatase n=1 Tax=Embleya hyalina TaxID=516124 RepID=A0A401YYA7_9ACTN|nr:phosphohistidine phosphatase [Embleya hyalina]